MWEQTWATLFLLPFLLLGGQQATGQDIGLLVLLGVVFTAVAHTLFIDGLKGVRGSTAGVISAMEPVYGIVAAALLLQEIPSVAEIVGGVIILGAAVYISLLPFLRKEMLDA